jgi:hypothetical protein
MVDTRRYSGPLPNQRFSQQVADVAMVPLMGVVSGEVTATKGGLPLGMARFAGEVVAVHLAVKSAGVDPTNPLSVEGDVFINNTSIFTTKPKIACVAGESAQQKTTYPEAGDTGITQAVLNKSATRFSAGDVLDWKYTIVRTATPSAEIREPMVIVELRPD